MHRLKQRKRQKKLLGRIIRWYGLFALGVIGAYGVVAAFHPGFFAYGLTHLSEALANDTITVTATVLDPPQTPVVSGTAVCSSQGVLSVELDWATDPNSTDYDISRDGNPLVSGLTASAYSDQAVAVATSYSYVVRANGPMGPGFADSLPVVVTTPADCQAAAPDPTVAVTTFIGEAAYDFDGTPKTTQRRPAFTGTTNIPNALVHITVHSGAPIIADITANAGGYWEWTVPANLSFGRHTLTARATDPLDSSRVIVMTYVFRVAHRDETGEGNEDDKEDEDESAEKDQQVQELLQGLEANFSLFVGREQSFFQGEEIPLTFTVIALAERYRETDLPIRFSLVDEKGNIILSVTRAELLRQGRILDEKLSAPLYAKPGRYTVRAEVMLGSINVSRSVPIEIEALPLIRLGNEREITYDEFMQHMGWFALLSSLLLIVWLFSLLWEYALFLQGDTTIDERDIRKAGYVSHKT